MPSYDSLRHSNQFTFICPLFNAKTKMGPCTKLRDIVWAGGSPPVRRGCQAAMKCGKCPAAEMVSKYNFDKNWTNDHHGSIQPKDGKLMAQILGKIQPVMMQESVMTKLGVSSQERALLAGANDRIADQLKTAPGEAPSRASDYSAPKRRKSAAPKTAPVNNAVVEAASRGDMAAALNAA